MNAQMSTTLSERFSLRYGPAEEEGEEIDLGGEEEAFEPLTGDLVDVGEAVAQELSLALPLFPRDPGASIDADLPARRLGR